jgi:hypothetical protein
MNMQEEIILLREAVARIETKLDSFPVCPNPSACLSLEPRLRALEDVENQRKGSWFSITVISTCMATLATVVISWWKNRGQ